MEENSSNADIQFSPCCFCGENISPTDTDPCRITVETVKDKWQTWFCHSGCFKKRIVEHPQIDLSPAHF